MFLGLDLSGEATKLNIVIIPFKNSHCPNSPLSVPSKVASVVSFALVTTVSGVGNI
jgi:hypothetical protein